MRYLLTTIGLLSAPLGAFALTWDFDEGTTWGWTAYESILGNLSSVTRTTVYSEVEAGVWRIAPVPNGERPAISLLSPLIGEDSALFDRVTLRLRILHDRPTGGNLLMNWSNAESRRRKQEDYRLASRSGFYTLRPQLYPIEWENVTIDIRALEAAAEARRQEPIATIWADTAITWQDTLFHVQLDLNLHTNPQGPADHPAFVEVDWIELTGAEELLFGELQPRAIAEAGLPGALFTEPRFSALGPSIGSSSSQGTLGDVDGDGDADLVVVWTHDTVVKVTEETFERTTQAGWTIAASDELGGLIPTREVLLLGEDRLGIAGGDFDGDGLLDLAFIEGTQGINQTLELWHNRGEQGFETILQLSDIYFEGLADSDGDSDVDLLVGEYDELRDELVWSQVIMWINNGAAGFADRNRFAVGSEEDLLPFLLAGQPLGEAVRLLWLRPCYQPQGLWRLTQPWAASQPSPLFFDAEVNPCNLHLLTDLDGDGAVELVGSPERDLFSNFDAGSTYHGLALWRVDASGEVERHDLLGPQVLVPDENYGGVLARDLTGDGLLDLAVVDVNPATGPALVVLVGQRDGVPVVEGRYPLPGVGSQVLAGDVNGDGAVDLVVLGRSVDGGLGGAFVFLNQSSPPTAVAVESATPSAFALGANYPNPFNPATTLPVSVAGAGDVAVTIYNVLGQPVRQVWNGPLAAGEHRLTWDGRDGQGQPVAAGVYLVRLHQGDHTRLRKMVKLE